jgi:subtilase-type serine protease
MPTQSNFKPKHLALAISLALACVELANAQQASEVADSTAMTNVGELSETSHREMALERLRAFLTDPSTVPIAFETPEKTFKGAAVNDLITLTDGASFSGLLDGGEGDNVLFLNAAAGGELKETRNFNGLVLARGDWMLSSKADFKEGVLVNSGTALTNLGSIMGDVYVEKGGSFAGKGAVGDLEVAGLLTVNGVLGSPRVKGGL